MVPNGAAGIFAAVALVLAMAGVYGVVSFMVSQRTSELGLRMALGAQPFEIVKLTVLSGLRPTLMGVASAGECRWRSRESSRRCSLDQCPRSAHLPCRSGSARLAAIIASAAPAIRAGRVDPVVALRSE